MKDLSLGMFDSGIGGLTVLKEVRQLLPYEDIIYLGDTARVPYGNRSPETVVRYSLENALFLLEKGIKMLIVACNTSSALALARFEEEALHPGRRRHRATRERSGEKDAKKEDRGDRHEGDRSEPGLRKGHKETRPVSRGDLEGVPPFCANC